MLSFNSSCKTLFIGFISLSFTVSAHAAIISFNNNSLTVNPGDSFSLTIQGTGFPAIVGGGLNLDFDASVLQIDQVTTNQSVFEFYLGNGIEEGHLNNAAGKLDDTAFNTFIGATGDFDIMTIDFTAIGSGLSQLQLSESSVWVFSDVYGNKVGDSLSYISAEVSVSAVPVPAAFWLFGSGLLFITTLVKRKAV